MITLAINCFSQDPEFVQAHGNIIYLNPALTGSYICPTLAQNLRLQWPNLTGTYNTYSASYHQLVRVLHGGLGFYYLYDDAGEGTLQTSRVNLAYAFHYETKNNVVLRAGITGGYVTRKADWDKLTFGDMIDPRYGYVYPTTEERPPSTVSFFDLGAGVAMYTKKFYANIAADHINQPDESFIRIGPGAKLPMKVTVNAGLHLPLGNIENHISINPDVVFYNQQDFNSTIISATARLSWLLVGTGVRIDSGYLFLLGVESKYFRVGYTYDFSNSRLADASSGSHEFLFAFKFIGLHPKKGTWTAFNLEAI